MSSTFRAAWIARPWPGWTSKPFIFVFNVDEDGLSDEKPQTRMRELVAPADAQNTLCGCQTYPGANSSQPARRFHSSWYDWARTSPLI